MTAIDEETKMEQRLSLITLGVADVPRAQVFHETLGWHVDGGVDDETDQVALFQAGGLIVAVWDRAKLAADRGVEDGGGWAPSPRHTTSAR